MTKNIHNRKLAFGLFVFLTVLVCLHIVSVFAVNQNLDWASDFNRWFSLDNEYNIPTAYNALLWVACATVCFLLAKRSKLKMNSWRWVGIGLFFAYLAADEFLVIHERFAEPVRHYLEISKTNPLYHAWVVIAAGVLAMIFVAIKSIKNNDANGQLQKQTLKRIAILGAIIISLEIIGTKLYFSYTVYQLGPVLVEEITEMGMASWILINLYGGYSRLKS